MSNAPIYSQAGNFIEFMQTGVDARTGQFSLSIALPLPPANQLCGPALSVTLAFSTLRSTVDKGFGLGWALGLSELHLDQNSPSLSLASGEQFAIDLQSSLHASDRQLRFIDQKLDTFRATWQADGSVRVNKKSGESEVLKKQRDSSARYLLSEMRSAEGRRLYFDWLPFGEDDFMLQRVRDERRTLLSVEKKSTSVTITLNPDTPHATPLKLLLSNDLLGGIQLPGLGTPITVQYQSVPVGNAVQLHLPTQVKNPLGAKDVIHWATDREGHSLPPGAPFPFLPRVSLWSHFSGARHTVLNHTYTWTGEHNFLGFGSDQAFDWAQGRDNLYEVRRDYQYSCSETLTDAQGQKLGSIKRTWDRFHLLISETSRLGDCETRKATRYGRDPTLNWEQQPAWCQLPHEISTTWTDHANAGANRTETTTYRYDEFGNIVHTRYPSGVEEHSEYYPAAGAEGCPPDSLGMVRHLRKKTVIPATADGQAPTLTTAYTYQALPSLIEDAPAQFVVASEQALDEKHHRLLEQTRQTHDISAGDHHARVLRSSTTLNGHTTTTEHAYRIEQDELITETTVIGFEDDAEHRCSSSSAQSLTSGLTTWACSESGAITRYAYDELGRVIRTVTADESAYRTERRAQYHLNDATARNARPDPALNPVMVEQTDVTGQRTRQWLDGEGRAVCVETEDLDHAPGTFKVIARSVFDALGRQTSQTSVDWLGQDEAPLSLTTRTHYDDWGQVTRTISPEGIHSHIVHDPVTQRLEQWRSADDIVGPRQVVLHSAAGSPIEEQHFDTDGALVRTTKLLRDGLDRIIEKRIGVPGADDIVTCQEYDHYGRVIGKTLPDGTRLSWTFAAHSDEQHPESLAITPAQSQASA